MRALVWVQHLLGTGHTVRAAGIAHALRATGYKVTLALGAPAPSTLSLEGLDTLALPPVAATDGSFRTIIAPDGTDYDALAATRADLLVRFVAEKRPEIVLTETFPFGRRRFAAEILPMVEAARARGATVAASIRDVLVRKPAAKEAEMARIAREFYDAVLIHADPALVRLEDSFAAADSLGDLIRYTGFVDGGATAAHSAGQRSGVVVSAGGSGVGAALVGAAVAAAALGDAGLPWHILVPHALGDRLAGWRAAAGPNVTLELNRPDFRALLAAAEVSVSQAGYNTVLDVLGAGPRMIFVPFAAHEETEQTDRAAALAARGLASVIAEDVLTPEALADAVAAALSRPLPAPPPIDRDGATRSAAILCAMRERVP